MRFKYCRAMQRDLNLFTITCYITPNNDSQGYQTPKILNPKIRKYQTLNSLERFVLLQASFEVRIQHCNSIFASTPTHHKPFHFQGTHLVKAIAVCYAAVFLNDHVRPIMKCDWCWSALFTNWNALLNLDKLGIGNSCTSFCSVHRETTNSQEATTKNARPLFCQLTCP